MEWNSDNFPAGLRVLVVDDDPICLLIVERLLRSCMYRVTTCGEAVIALSMLRENRSRFDVVLSDVHMPHMDGFKLLELVRLEMDVPVIMMSANGETSNVMKGISQGACDYLLKPVRLEELRNIWQHVVRKQHVSAKESEYTPDLKDDTLTQITQTESKTAIHFTEEGNASCNSQRRRKGYLDDDSANEEDDNLATAKRLRVVWSVELHQKFVGAINHLGLEQAVPKRILDLMNVPGLTRENVASHLQKYRLYLKKMRGSINQKLGMPMCISSSDTSFMNSLTFLNGFSSSQQSPAHFSRQVVMPLQPTAYVKNCEINNKQGVATPPINNKGMGTNQYFDPRLPSLPSVSGLAMESNIGAAFASDGQLRFVTQSGFDAPHQQNLMLPKSTGTLWIEKPNSFEPEFLTGDHLFIHQLETAVDKLPRPCDLNSVLDLIER